MDEKDFVYLAQLMLQLQQPNYKRFGKLNDNQPSPVYDVAQYCFKEFKRCCKYSNEEAKRILEIIDIDDFLNHDQNYVETKVYFTLILSLTFKTLK